MKKFYATLVAVVTATTAMALPTHSAGKLELATSPIYDAAPHSISGKVSKIDKAELTYKGKLQASVMKILENDTWVEFGDGKYVDPVLSSLFGLPAVSLDVKVEKSTTTAGAYRIVEPYKNYTLPTGLTYDASQATPIYVVVEGNAFYLDDYTTGVIYQSKVVGVTTQVGGLYPDYTLSQIAQVYTNGLGIYNEGVLTYPVSMVDEGVSYTNMLGFLGSGANGYYKANTDGQFKIVLPGATAKDYSVAIDNESCTDDNKFTFTMTLGADVASYKTFAAAGNFPASDANLQYIAQNGQEFTADKNVITLDLSSEKSSLYTFLVATLDADGNFKEGARAIFYVVKDEADQWEAVDGQATYTDDIIASLYTDIDCKTHLVSIEKSKGTPGYYRLVNPYATPYAYASYNEHTGTHKHYIYINAANPDKVYIEESPIGFEMGDGAMCVSSLAYLTLSSSGKTEDDVDAGHWGTLKDGVITFPQKTLLVRETKYNDGSWYYANTSDTGSFKVVLPESEGVNDILTDDVADAPVEFFNLQGQRVDNPVKGQLLIRRQGTTASKVLVK